MTSADFCFSFRAGTGKSWKLNKGFSAEGNQKIPPCACLAILICQGFACHEPGSHLDRVLETETGARRICSHSYRQSGGHCHRFPLGEEVRWKGRARALVWTHGFHDLRRAVDTRQLPGSRGLRTVLFGNPRTYGTSLCSEVPLARQRPRAQLSSTSAISGLSTSECD